jgi:hypothetical protein
MEREPVSLLGIFIGAILKEKLVIIIFYITKTPTIGQMDWYAP